MRAGDLTEWVTIQRAVTTADAIGGEVENAPIVVASNLPAAVEPLGIGAERLQAGQLRGSVSKLVRIRYREDITEAMRVIWGSRTLEIGLVAAKRLDDETLLYCAEVQ